jgi:hypothetical protein
VKFGLSYTDRARGVSRINRVFKNKHQAVSQGVRRFGKRSIFEDMCAFTKAAQRRITARGAVFQHPVKRSPELMARWFGLTIPLARFYIHHKA